MSEEAKTALRGHTFEEHVGEVQLSISAGTLDELFVEAGMALAELLAGGARRAACGAPEQVEVRARDLPALLVAWLNELVYRSDVNKRVYSEVRVEELTENVLKATIRGSEPEHVRTAVKAATLHGLLVERVRDGYHAKVVLDV